MDWQNDVGSIRSCRLGLRQQVGGWLRTLNYRERLIRYVGGMTQGSRRERPPQELTSCPGTRVLVMAPHMDDETAGCGGTIRKMVAEGKEVSVLFMTDGRQGDRQLSALSGAERRSRQQELVAIRKQESAKACGILGIGAQHFLDQEDACLRSTEAVRQTVGDVFAQIRPDVVLAPFFTDQHADHKMTARILAEVCEERQWAGVCLAYEVWTPLYPNTVVDITETADVKRQALSVYHSQLKDNDLLGGVLGLNAYRHMLLGGVGFAEAFWMGGADDFYRLYRWYQGSDA